MSGVDDITVLQADRAPLCKTWRADGTISDFDDAFRYMHSATRVRNIRELSRLLLKLESKTQMCVVRGRYIGDEEALKVPPDDKGAVIVGQGKGALVRRLGAVFKDHPLHALCIDVDKFEPLTSDPVTDPVAAIHEYIATMLPPAFHDASFHWALSASAGHPDKSGLRAHLWFWLSEPRATRAVRTWAEAYGDKYQLDPALYTTVQPHFTAAPIFEAGVADPVPVRSGFVKGKGDSVDIDIADLPPAEQPSAGDAPARTDISDAQLEDLKSALAHPGLLEAAGAESVCMKVGYALLSLGELGHGLWLEFCAHAADHSATPDPNWPESWWTAHQNGSSRADFLTIYKMAAEYGWENPIKDGASSQVAQDFDILPQIEIPPEADRFRLIPLHELASRPQPPWLIRGILPRAALAEIFGESGSGKSFLALDMAFALSRGVAWRDRKVQRIKVAWLAAEAAYSLGVRAHAYAHQHGLRLTDLDVPVIATTPDLRDRNQIDRIIGKVKEAGAELLVIDTLAAASGDADENAKKDMGPVMQNCLRIHADTGCMVLLVHHSGKDLSRGGRGSTTIKAALDLELEVSRNGDSRAVRVSKNRLGAEGETFGFRLVPVLLGTDADGAEITSCVVEAADVPTKVPKQKPMRANQQAVYDAALELMALDGSGAPEIEIIEQATKRLVREPGKRDRRERDAARALQTLCDSGVFQLVDGRVLLVN